MDLKTPAILLSDNVGSAVKLMHKFGVTVLPVKDEHQRAAGLVSADKILRSFYEGLSSSSLDSVPGMLLLFDKFITRQIRDIMHEKIKKTSPDTSLHEILSLFYGTEEVVESVMVVDDEETVLGIIRPENLTHSMFRHLSGEDSV